MDSILEMANDSRLEKIRAFSYLMYLLQLTVVLLENTRSKRIFREISCVRPRISDNHALPIGQRAKSTGYKYFGHGGIAPLLTDFTTGWGIFF